MPVQPTRLARGAVQLFDSSDEEDERAQTPNTTSTTNTAPVPSTSRAEHSQKKTVSSSAVTSTHKHHTSHATTHSQAHSSARDVAKKKKNVTEDDEDEDDDEDDLDAQLAEAAARELRRNPHAESGRARPVHNRYTVKKMDLFGDDDDEDDGEDEEDDTKAYANINKESSNVAGRARAERSALPPPRAAKDNGRAANADASADALVINQNYAAKYEEVKRKKELQQLTHKYGTKLGNTRGILEHTAGNDSSSSNSEADEDDDEDEDEEDDDAVLLTEDNELAFARALVAVRRAVVAAKTHPQRDETLPKLSSEDANATQLPKEDSRLAGHDKDCHHRSAERKSRPQTEDHSESGHTEKAEEEDAERVFRQARFFPDPEEQVRRNTEVFAAVVRQRQAAKQHTFTLADEYRRALFNAPTNAAENEEEKDTGNNSDANGSGGRRLKPQSAAEREARRAFLDAAAQASDAVELITTSSTAKSNAATAPTSSLSRAEKERRRLLQEAFNLTITAAPPTREANHTHSSEPLTNSSTHADGGAIAEQPGQSRNSHTHNTNNFTEAKDKDDEEAFIRDFFVNELWRPDGHTRSSDEGGTALGATGRRYSAAQLAQEEADATFYNDAEAWERDFQARRYRHEEIAAAGGESQTGYETTAVPSFARPVGEAAAGLLRASHAAPTARAAARERRRQRAREAQERQVEELKRLKHLKRMEIEEQRALIATVAGLGSGQSKGDALHKTDAEEEANEAAEAKDKEGRQRVSRIWTDADLDAPYDPKEFAAKMQQLFDDDYYDAAHVDEAEVDFMEAELDSCSDVDRAEEAPEPTRAQSDAVLPSATLAPAQRHARGEDIWDDVLYPRATLTGSSGEVKATNDDSDADTAEDTDAKLAQLRQELKTKEEDYMRLHYEDTLDGGSVKTRFRYRSVAPEDFTLSVEDILALDDRQLNMIAPMNCYAAYLDRASNARDARAIARRRSHGMRLVDSERHSRRYGDVAATAVLRADMTPEEGEAVARRLHKRLREEEKMERAGGMRRERGGGGREEENNAMHRNGGSKPMHERPPMRRPAPREWQRGRGRGGGPARGRR